MSLQRAIEKTIKYAQKFGVDLTANEVRDRLIGSQIFRLRQGYGGQADLRDTKKKNVCFEEKMRKAKELAGIIGNEFKNIVMIGVTGSVAAGYPKDEDDIDLMIITQANCLWLTRLKLRWFIYRRGIPHRKYGEAQKKDEFCFNLWLDESNLKLPKSKQNLKNAVDLVLMKPVYDINGTYGRFLGANKWARKWVATPYEEIIFNLQSSIFREKKDRIVFKKVINWLVFWPQWGWMKRKIDQELVDYHRAFFHKG